jgi:hypothetical protein
MYPSSSMQRSGASAPGKPGRRRLRRLVHSSGGEGS